MKLKTEKHRSDDVDHISTFSLSRTRPDWLKSTDFHHVSHFDQVLIWLLVFSSSSHVSTFDFHQVHDSNFQMIVFEISHTDEKFLFLLIRFKRKRHSNSIVNIIKNDRVIDFLFDEDVKTWLMITIYDHQNARRCDALRWLIVVRVSRFDVRWWQNVRDELRFDAYCVFEDASQLMSALRDRCD